MGLVNITHSNKNVEVALPEIKLTLTSPINDFELPFLAAKGEGIPLAFNVVDAGLGYAVNDVISVDAPNDSNLQLTVLTVGGLGELLTAGVTQEGRSYADATTYPTTAISGVGVGATIEIDGITLNDGVVVDIPIVGVGNEFLLCIVPWVSDEAIEALTPYSLNWLKSNALNFYPVESYPIESKTKKIFDVILTEGGGNSEKFIYVSPSIVIRMIGASDVELNYAGDSITDFGDRVFESSKLDGAIIGEAGGLGFLGGTYGGLILEELNYEDGNSNLSFVLKNGGVTPINNLDTHALILFEVI